MYIADSSTVHAGLCISVQNLNRKLLTVPARLQTHCTLCTLAVSTHLHMYILYYQNRKMDVSLDRPVKMTTQQCYTSPWLEGTQHMELTGLLFI